MSKLASRYLVVTFVIMLLSWGICLVCSAFGIYLTNMPLLYVPYLVGGLSPTIASFLVLKQRQDVSNFRQWLKTLFDFKHNLASYLLLIGFAGVFFLILCVICGYQPGAPIFALVFMVPMMLFGGGLEEAGWRGILQPEVEEKYGYTLATLFVAVIWWLWHLPLFYIPGVSQYGTSFFEFGFNVLGLSFALSAIKKVTGSTWLCILFHCIINSLHGIYMLNSNIVGNLAAATVLILLSYLCLWVQNKKQVFH